MEIRARYIQMGAFTLAVIAVGFAFVYWLNNAGGLRERAVYRIRFENSVSGLLRGSAVHFNGIRVGEVTALALDPASPRQVQATVVIDRSTPVRTDTAVGIDFQGLMGSPVIALTGGVSASPLVAAKGDVPLLVADPAASQSMSQAARDALRRLDTVVAENAQPLRSMIANLDTFSGALARNSDRLDGIVAGLERMTGGAAAKGRIATYDLTAPSAFPAAEKAGRRAAGDPRPDGAERARFGEDPHPLCRRRQLAPARCAMERHGAEAAAGADRPGLRERRHIGRRQPPRGGRHRRLSAADRHPPLPDRCRRTAHRRCRAGGQAARRQGPYRRLARLPRTAPAAGMDAAAATSALDQAFGTAATELVTWTSRAIADQSAAAVAPKGPARGKATRG